LEAEISLAPQDLMILSCSPTRCTLHIQRWPRDIDLKKGLLSGLWKDLKMEVSAMDASVTDDTGSGVPCREFLEILEGADEGQECAAIRWAVVLGDDERL
jgi:hypothetical protein